MKLYYYAHTGHKYGLDRAKRAVAILKKLNQAGVDTMLLVNDFRAGLAVRDLGIQDSITIESIQDIDAIAQTGDVIIIDSPEDDHGRLVKYCADFKQVFRFAEHDDDKTIHGEIMLTLDCDPQDSISSIIVDDIYFEKKEKEERTLFFLGDADPQKILLKNSDILKKYSMELLLGHYFYVKYENDLEKIFTKLHESEEYSELISSSSNIITSSYQTALEASASGAKVTFVELIPLSYKQKELFKSLGIIIGIDLNNLNYQGNAVEEKIINNNNCLSFINNEKIINKILNYL